MYEFVDIDGGSIGLPVWMTESRWSHLRISSDPHVSLSALNELKSLLTSLKKASNEENQFSSEGTRDEKCGTEDSSSTMVGESGTIK